MPTSRRPWIWSSPVGKRHNRLMELTPEQVREIEEKLEELERLDPAEMPKPAAELAAILGRLLDEAEDPA